MRISLFRASLDSLLAEAVSWSHWLIFMLGRGTHPEDWLLQLLSRIFAPCPTSVKRVNGCAPTWRHGDLDVGERDVHVHALARRLRQRQRQRGGRQQPARRARPAPPARPSRPAQPPRRQLQPRHAALRHHALLRLAQLEPRLHLSDERVLTNLSPHTIRHYYDLVLNMNFCLFNYLVTLIDIHSIFEYYT